MMRRFIFTFILAALAMPVGAARKPSIIGCATPAINAGLCEAGDSLLVVPIRGPQATVDAVVLEYALAHAYQPTTACEQERVTDGRILVKAGVTQGDCTAGELGTEIDNPQTPAEYAAAVAQQELVRHVIRHRRQQAEAAVVVDETDPSEGAR